MDTNRQMIIWCSAWALIGGTVVCTGCMQGQVLSDSAEEFAHQSGCKAMGEVAVYPWAALHQILDEERG
jgi:hypothetical protein